MKGIVAERNQRYLDTSKAILVKAVLIQSICFVMGILISRGSVFGRYYPFGISIVASVPYGGIISAVLGASIGYIVPLSSGVSIRYISAIIAAAAVRWTLNDLKRLKTHILYAPVVAMSVSLVTGLAMDSVNGFEINEVTMSMIEAILSAGAAYFLSQTCGSLFSGKFVMINQKELCSFIISLCIIILSLSSVSLGSVSLGRSVAVTMILVFSYCLGITGGSISGVTAGVILSLPSFGLTYISGAYAFGGLIAGLFSPLGRISVSLAFIFSSIIVSFQTGDISRLVSGIYEIIVGAIVFFCIPGFVFDWIIGMFPMCWNNNKSEGIRKYMVHRLRMSSEAILSVPGFVGEVSEKLSKIESPKTEDICTKVIYSTCNKCSHRTLCWDAEKESTRAEFDSITLKMNKGDIITSEGFSKDFIKRCGRIDTIIKQVNGYQKEFTSKTMADKRIEELRGIVSEQFNGMGSLLGDISKEFEIYERFDEECATRIQSKLKISGLNPISVIYKVNKFDKVFIEIELKDFIPNKILQKKLMRELSIMCGRVLDEPAINVTGDRVIVQVTEKTPYSVSIGITQHICHNGKFCGDNYSYFNDGAGHFIVIISDGMGTGGRAAVDGAMASELMSKLIKSGVSFRCAVKIVNSALMVKSGDESLATLDIISVDLFTGNTVFMKAGAPMSLFRREGKVVSIDSASLPIGIFTDAQLLYDKAQMGDGDWILMMSDGASDTGDGWIESELQSWKSDSARNLSKHIVDEAARRSENGHDDDITVIALRVDKNI